MKQPVETLPASDPSLANGDVMVWDPLVRIFHWSLVGAFAVAFVSGDELERLHIIAGYMVLALVAFRIVWGCIGSRHARFSDFVTSPHHVILYLKDLLALRARRTLGHNPAGGAMVVALLVMLLATSATGYTLTVPAYARLKWLEEAHEVVANLTLGLVCVHIAGVLASSYVHRENLIRAMITGKKRNMRAGER